MTPALLSSLRQILGDYRSPADCERVVRAVLEHYRELDVPASRRLAHRLMLIERESEDSMVPHRQAHAEGWNRLRSIVREEARRALSELSQTAES